MDTEITSAEITQAINHFEFLNREIFEHNALVRPKTNQN